MLKKVTEDLFNANPIYQRTPARAIQVVPPLGYEVIQALEAKTSADPKKHKTTNQKRKVFQFPETPFVKTMYNKKGPEHQEDFQVKDLGRRNQLVSGENFKEFVDKQQSIIQNRKLVSWFHSPEEELIKYIELLQYVPRDHLVTIHDYALSEYFYLCQCSNPNFRDYINLYLKREIIQYKITPTYCQSTLCQGGSQTAKINIQDIQHINRFIQSANEANLASDPFYTGYRLFLGLEDMHPIEGEDFASQENRFLKYLQYYLLMLTGLLGDGQIAILKVYSSIYQKTNQFIYMLRLMFAKLTIVKPMLSNHLDHQKFIICEGYRKLAGEKVRRMLSENFDLLSEFGENKLLIKPEVIDKTDYKSIMTDYNNRTLHNEFKKLDAMFSENPNLLYLPNEQFLAGKLKSAFSPDDYVNKSLSRLFEQKRRIQQQDIKMEQKKKIEIEAPRREEEGAKKSVFSILKGNKKADAP